MAGCCNPGSRVWLRDSGNPTRKYPLSWELVEAAPGVLVGINTALANRLVREALERKSVNALQAYRTIRSEVRYGRENSRIDLLLQGGDAPDCYVEVKNVTLVDNRTAYFPDAVSVRASRHLRELQHMVNSGRRAAIFFCVQRKDADSVQPADTIDPEYAETLRRALAHGVEAFAYRARVSPACIELRDPLPVICS
jgi:sugar fermentation stimulation protein A